MGVLDFGIEGIEVVEEIVSLQNSDTQSVKLVEILKDGNEMYSLQKWWKKDPDEDWRVGKGFQLSKSQMDELVKAYNNKL